MGISLAPHSSTPKMASLVQQGWKAKRSKGSKGPQAILPEQKLQTVRKAKEKPTYSPLLSRRLHRIVSLTVKIPRREPFPPPLVWNPPPRPPPRSPPRWPGRLYARAQAMWPEQKLQTVPKAKEKPMYSPLLSRRLHKITSLKVEIPRREPLPPPLVRNPPPRPPPRWPGRRYARPQANSPEQKLQTVPKAKEKPTYSPLLSRRLHRIVSLTVKIPRREPFPPPLVWNPDPPPLSPPSSPPRWPGRLYARPFARPPARPHPYKRPQSSISQRYPLASH